MVLLEVCIYHFTLLVNTIFFIFTKQLIPPKKICHVFKGYIRNCIVSHHYNQSQIVPFQELQ